MIKEHDLIQDYDLTKLHVDPTNENELVGKDKEAHEKSLDERGVLQIILIDQNDMIINGTHTWKKLIKEGNKTGPVIKKHYKNQAERIIDRQILNYGPRGTPIRDLQKENLLKIQKSGNMENFVKLMNQPKDQLLLLLGNDNTTFKESEPITETPAKTRCKEGQMYALGKHRLMCGDATSSNDLLKLLESDTPRLLYTDPPFDMKEYDYVMPFLESFKDIEILILNGDHGTADMLQLYHKYFVGFYVITFNSPSRYPNQPMMSHRLFTHYRKGKSNFQNLHDAFATIHEMSLRKDGLVRQEKPLELPRKFIMHYTLPGEMVIDLFGGSGSTMIACEHLQRTCLTMEKDPSVCDKIIQRYEKFTELKAKLIC